MPADFIDFLAIWVGAVALGFVLSSVMTHVARAMIYTPPRVKHPRDLDDFADNIRGDK